MPGRRAARASALAGGRRGGPARAGGRPGGSGPPPPRPPKKEEGEEDGGLLGALDALELPPKVRATLTNLTTSGVTGTAAVVAGALLHKEPLQMLRLDPAAAETAAVCVLPLWALSLVLFLPPWDAEEGPIVALPESVRGAFEDVRNASCLLNPGLAMVSTYGRAGRGGGLTENKRAWRGSSR